LGRAASGAKSAEGTLMMQLYEFDDEVLKPGRFRFHVPRVLSVNKHKKVLLEKQNGICPLCNGALVDDAVVDHIISVKQFAYNLSIPLTDAYVQCHALDNLRAVHSKCNNFRNRRKLNENDSE
jgi:5-methylcytosine-specific restriction endonuclease McrA